MGRYTGRVLRLSVQDLPKIEGCADLPDHVVISGKFYNMLRKLKNRQDYQVTVGETVMDATMVMDAIMFIGRKRIMSRGLAEAILNQEQMAHLEIGKTLGFKPISRNEAKKD